MSKTGTRNQFALSGAWNFRDVGGARTVDGRTVRSGVLFRSSELSRLDDDGRRGLSSLGVSDVFDLRGDAEMRRSGADAVPPGVRVHTTPFENHKGERAPHEAGAVVDAEAQKAYMMRAYTSFPSLEGARSAISNVVDALTRGDGAVLVHCAAGKDRAGWTIATVLRAAGVTDEDILADYLLSNDAIEPLRTHVLDVWSSDSDEAPPKLSDALLGVTENYYRRGLNVVTDTYGSFDAYLDALGIDGKARADLQAALLGSTT
ncbi:MAG: tyrosine-protein phosphatase [Rhodococcus sp. (in: high G+C Gram-positive bacteria)]